MAVAITLLMFAAASSAGIAQTRAALGRDELNRRVSYFYLQGHVEDVPGILSQWRAAGGPVPQLLGFIVGVAAKYPEKIDKMFPATLDNGAQRLAVVGVRIGISTGRAEKLAHRYGWPEKDLATVGYATTIDKLPIKVPQDLDMFWGASFATGNPVYPQRILDYYVSVTNRRDIDIVDVYTLIRGVPGYSPANLKTLREKHGDKNLRYLLMASAALWSLASNGTQHAFVKGVIDSYVTLNPNTPASIGLRTVQAARAGAIKRVVPR